MTDKHIIIDGCDVSGCKYFDSHCKECKAEYYTRYGYEIVKFNSCKDNPNCYFKQLKRKEQECEELKKEIKTKTYHWEQCTEEILKGTKQFVDRMEKAEKTLTEIKDLLLKTPTDSPMHCINAKSVILQKISEVEKQC